MMRFFPEQLASKIICTIVLLLFAVAWPLDLALHFNLATHGALTEGRVLETWTTTAKSKQIIHVSKVEFLVNGARYERSLSGPELHAGNVIQVQYAPWCPYYAVLDNRPQSPPAPQTIVMRLIFGAFFSIMAIVVLRQEKSRAIQDHT